MKTSMLICLWGLCFDPTTAITLAERGTEDHPMCLVSAVRSHSRRELLLVEHSCDEVAKQIHIKSETLK